MTAASQIVETAFCPRRQPAPGFLRRNLPTIWPCALAFFLLNPALLLMAVIGDWGGRLPFSQAFGSLAILPRGIPSVLALWIAYRAFAHWTTDRAKSDDLQALPLTPAERSAAHASVVWSCFPVFAALHLAATALLLSPLGGGGSGDLRHFIYLPLPLVIGGELALLGGLHAAGAAMVAGNAVSGAAARTAEVAFGAFALAWIAWFGCGFLLPGLLWLGWFASPLVLAVSFLPIAAAIAGAVSVGRAYLQLAAGRSAVE